MLTRLVPTVGIVDGASPTSLYDPRLEHALSRFNNRVLPTPGQPSNKHI